MCIVYPSFATENVDKNVVGLKKSFVSIFSKYQTIFSIFRLLGSETEFKEFEPSLDALKYETRFKHSWFH